MAGFYIFTMQNGWILYIHHACRMAGFYIFTMQNGWILYGWILYIHHACRMAGFLWLDSIFTMQIRMDGLLTRMAGPCMYSHILSALQYG